MTIEANKAIVSRYKVDILNSRDFDALDGVVAFDYLDPRRSPGRHRGSRA
jgi:hypothetical protein